MKKHRIKNSLTRNLSGKPAPELRPSTAKLQQANLTLTETNRMISNLQAVTAAVSRSLDLNRSLHAGIEKLARIFRFDATRIYLHDEAAHSVFLQASFEDDPARIAVAKSFANGQGIVGWVAETGQSLIFENLQAAPVYQRLSRTQVLKRFGYHFFAAFPIKGEGAVSGAIACAGMAPRRLSSSEVELLEAVADQIAVAIENSRLYEKARLKVQELELKTSAHEQADKVKDEFLGLVARELRTPINIIMDYTAAFKDGTLGEISPLQQDALAKIGREAEDLSARVNTLLTAAARQSGPKAPSTGVHPRRSHTRTAAV
ncbi:MAG TPA: GAF domain-containing protein [Verrucomicrobiae bacterium]|nr:GAF domain-containing protein [Verrucomicrobiae bacterium]